MITGLTGDEPQSGIHRLLGDSAGIAAELDRAGWRTATIEPVTRISLFYEELATALDWPEYFGRNLDALWDCLTDLDRPTVLILTDWTRLARARPHGWKSILELFDERCRLDPPFAVVLADPVITGPPD